MGTKLSRAVRAWRKKEQITQKAAGKILGISEPYFNIIENGKRVPTKASVLKKFEKVLGKKFI